MSWNSKSYFSKAKLYWEKAHLFDDSSSDFILYLTFFCEFIIRGVLTKKNPILNAMVNQDSILYACGIEDPKAKENTISLKHAFEYLKYIMPEITASEFQIVKVLYNARNSELHSDKDALGQIDIKKFMPDLYCFILKIMNHINVEPATILGEETQHAIEVANARKNAREIRAKQMIELCKDTFYHLSEEAKIDKRKKALSHGTMTIMPNGDYIISEKCPACSMKDLNLLCRPIGKSDIFLEDTTLLQKIKLSPVNFSCACCNLQLEGLDLLIAAGFKHAYTIRDDVDPLEHFNIDVADFVDVDEIINDYRRGVMYDMERD